MHNREDKNWNNFALGALVMILPLLALPQKLVNLLIVALGFFIALFSLARTGPNQPEKPNDQGQNSPTV